MDNSVVLGFIVTMLIALVWCVPTDMPSTRSTASPIGDTIKQLTDQLMDSNTTTSDILDVRTPPKLRQQQQINQRNKFKAAIENSHAGVAIPIDEDSIELEETTKKLSFYKVERPTTNSGLSTWILLSGQSSSTPKPTKKTTIKPHFDTIKSSTSKPPIHKPLIYETITRESSSVKPFEKIRQNQKMAVNMTKLSSKSSAENETAMEKQNNTTVVIENKPPRIVKPIFKKRTTTAKPSTTTTAKQEKESNSTVGPQNKNTTKSSKLSKVKASILNNALNKKNNVTVTDKKQTPSVTVSDKKHATTTIASKSDNITADNTDSINATLADTKVSSVLPLEAKDGDTELSSATTSTTEKKKKNKKKKNKNRRRKPSNNSKLEGVDDKPIGTQIYSYLSREIMPTVGVGLVGLMVTAGLASYFLYPFSPLRRNYIVDRKDHGGGYYYNDDHSGGMLEEEAIGKVIAGMSSNSYHSNAYKTPASRNAYPTNNVRYRNVDRGSEVQQTSDNSNVVSSSFPSDPQNSISSVTYGRDPYIIGTVSKATLEDSTPVAVPEHGPRNLDSEMNVQVDEKQRFVVGNVPKEFQTAGALPRNLENRRKRRDIPIQNELDNEIDPNDNILSEKTTETVKANNESVASTDKISTTTQITTENTKGSFVDMIKNLLHFKIRFGLQLVQNVTKSVSSYISKVQSRLDDHYRNKSKEKTS